MREKSKFRRILAISIALLVLGAWYLGILRRANPQLGAQLRPFATVENQELKEASGLVQSPSRPEIFWSHNDSGDYPRIFAFHQNGEAVGPTAGVRVENATLVDWEDVTVLRGDLYLSDMGNNLNRRKDLGVYQVPEPQSEKVTSVKAKRFLPVEYPDQHGFPPLSGWNFDCEATFAWNGKLYFITKSRPPFRVYVQGSSAGLYRLDSEHTGRVNVLTKVDQIEDLGGWVTSADANPEGTLLAVLVESPIQSVWLFEKPKEGDRFFSQATSVRRFVFHDGGQLEALAFRQTEQGREEILLLNEARQLFRLPLSAFSKA